MATTIINNVSLASGEITSSAVASVSDICVGVKVSSATSEEMFCFVRFKRSTGNIDDFVRDENGKIISMKIIGNGEFNFNLVGVNAVSFNVVVTPNGTHDGVVLAEY